MDYSARLKRLRELLLALPCQALLIEHPTHLLYLTGQEVSLGKLVVTDQDACFFVDGRYFESCSQQPLYPVLLSSDSNFKDWLSSHRIETLGFDADKTPYKSYLNLSKLGGSLNPLMTCLPVDSPVQELRLIKDQDEIDCLKQAAQLGYQGYEHISSLLEKGISEAELAIELEIFWKRKGAKKLAFDPIIAFGPNSSMPHYRAGSTRLDSNTSILIDIGVVLQHYHSDMTRVLFFGEVPDKMKTIYAIVEEAKQRAQALCRPGTLVEELDQAARSFIASKGYGDCFTHSLGHGVGLDIHEPPILRSQSFYSQIPLQAGMVITIEPGIYISGLGG